VNAKGFLRNKDPGELYEILSKYLNIILVYICGKGYLVQSTRTNVESMIQTTPTTVNKDRVVNERVIASMECSNQL